MKHDDYCPTSNCMCHILRAARASERRKVATAIKAIPDRGPEMKLSYRHGWADARAIAARVAEEIGGES